MRQDGIRSRDAILRQAAALATVEGVQGLSLSRLADAVGMSKSGIYAHFGSKEELQLATVAVAGAILSEEVFEPGAEVASGVARLEAYIDLYLKHVRESIFPGGCFFASAVTELDTHPGPVRDAALAVAERWSDLLRAEVEAAQAAGELDPSLDAGQLAFELGAYVLAANVQYVASQDPAALEPARVAARNRLRDAAA